MQPNKFFLNNSHTYLEIIDSVVFFIHLSVRINFQIFFFLGGISVS